MYYFLQHLIHKSSGETMIYEGFRNGVHHFVSQTKMIEINDSEALQNDFEVVYEFVKLFGKTKVKRIKRGLLDCGKLENK